MIINFDDSRDFEDHILCSMDSYRTKWLERHAGRIIDYPVYIRADIIYRRSGYKAKIDGFHWSIDSYGNAVIYILLMVMRKDGTDVLNTDSWTRTYHRIENIREHTGEKLTLEE